MDAVGSVIADRYELRELVGRGGMATVWRAVLRGPAGFEVPVALKRMLPALAEDPELVTMFVEEAKIAALLAHPNVTRVHELGRDALGFFLVMEWVEGLDLSRLCQRTAQLSAAGKGEPLPWWMVLHVVIDALTGLHAAHTRVASDGTPAPVFHRDVDPKNVLVGTNGTSKLTDFGLAFAADRVRLTQPGILKGKLGYVAPELLEVGAEPSVLTDLYSMGIVLWESLTGTRLHRGRTDVETLESARRAEVPPLSEHRRDLPPTLEPLLCDVLARDPRQRIPAADELADLLRDVIYGEGIRPNPADIGRVVARASAVREEIDRARIAELLAAPPARPLPSVAGEPSLTPEIPLVRRKGGADQR